MKLRVACIGAGYFAKYHIDAWQRMEDVELVAICDLELSKASDLGALYGVNKYYDSLDLLFEREDFDVLDVITPPATHHHICKLAFEHDKHVICQKPVSPQIDEILDLIRIADAINKRFIVHENFRFQPWYAVIKRLIDERRIGDRLHTITHKVRTGDGWGKDAYLDRQPYFRDMERFFVYETGIHFVDVFRYLNGEVSSVYASLRKLNPVIKGEDAGVVLFNFENGAKGLLDFNRYNQAEIADPRYTFGEMVLEGSEGSIFLKGDGDIIMKRLDAEPISIPYHHENLNFGSDCVYHTQTAIAEALTTNAPFEHDASTYLKNIAVQEAIYESASNEMLVAIKGFFSN